jgi:hypothetical protein
MRQRHANAENSLTMNKIRAVSLASWETSKISLLSRQSEDDDTFCVVEFSSLKTYNLDLASTSKPFFFLLRSDF